jgi:hypothetical protein
MMNCQTCLDVPECSNKASTLISGTTAFRNDTLTAHWKSKSHKACEERKQLFEKAQSRHEFPCTSKEERPSIACVGSMVNCVRRQARENEEKIKKTHQHCLPCLQNGVSFLGLPKAINTPGKEWFGYGKFLSQ